MEPPPEPPPSPLLFELAQLLSLLSEYDGDLGPAASASVLDTPLQAEKLRRSGSKELAKNVADEVGKHILPLPVLSSSLRSPLTTLLSLRSSRFILTSSLQSFLIPTRAARRPPPPLPMLPPSA